MVSKGLTSFVLIGFHVPNLPQTLVGGRKGKLQLTSYHEARTGVLATTLLSLQTVSKQRRRAAYLLG